MQPGVPAPVRVYIRDHLAADQVSERVRIVVDSREAGRFSLNQHYPASVIRFEVAPGEHSYVVEVNTTLRTDGGKPEKQKYVGQGTFMASANRIFRLAADRTGEGWMVHLEADQDEQEIDQ